MALAKSVQKRVGPPLREEGVVDPLRSTGDPLSPGPGHFAHRGIHGPHWPENSLAAFKAAVRGRAGIECDLRLSLDGEVMVFHDLSLKRMCGVDGAVETTRAADLARLRLSGGDQHIPTLRDLLLTTRGDVPLILELKTRNGNFARLTSRVAKDLERYPGRVGVMSGDPLVGAYLALMKPSIRRGLPISGRNSTPIRWIKLLLAQPQFIVVKAHCVGHSWAKRLRWSVPVYAWTICDLATWNRVEPDADALIWEASNELQPVRGHRDKVFLGTEGAIMSG